MVIGMKLQLFQKEPKKSNEFAPDETLAVLVPLGERIYINSILCLLYFFLKIWVMISLNARNPREPLAYFIKNLV